MDPVHVRLCTVDCTDHEIDHYLQGTFPVKCSLLSSFASYRSLRPRWSPLVARSILKAWRAEPQKSGTYTEDIRFKDGEEMERVVQVGIYADASQRLQLPGKLERISWLRISRFRRRRPMKCGLRFTILVFAIPVSLPSNAVFQQLGQQPKRCMF
jgi:hypothetical protein